MHVAREYGIDLPMPWSRELAILEKHVDEIVHTENSHSKSALSAGDDYPIINKQEANSASTIIKTDGNGDYSPSSPVRYRLDDLESENLENRRKQQGNSQPNKARNSVSSIKSFDYTGSRGEKDAVDGMTFCLIILDHTFEELRAK